LSSPTSKVQGPRSAAGARSGRMPAATPAQRDRQGVPVRRGGLHGDGGVRRGHVSPLPAPRRDAAVPAAEPGTTVPAAGRADRAPHGDGWPGPRCLPARVQGTRIAFSWHRDLAHRDPDRRDPRLHRGLLRGKTDDFIVWLYSTFASIPGLLFILAIAMVVGKGCSGLSRHRPDDVGRAVPPDPRRSDQAQDAGVRRGGAGAGLGHFRIIFRHILPTYSTSSLCRSPSVPSASAPRSS